MKYREFYNQLDDILADRRRADPTTALATLRAIGKVPTAAKLLVDPTWQPNVRMLSPHIAVASTTSPDRVKRLYEVFVGSAEPGEHAFASATVGHRLNLPQLEADQRALEMEALEADSSLVRLAANHELGMPALMYREGNLGSLIVGMFAVIPPEMCEVAERFGI